MRRLGEVVRVAQGLAICRSPGEDHPDFGTEAIDEDLESVGTVVDVFGPVGRPYVAVSPSEDRHLPGLVGGVIYARD